MNDWNELERQLRSWTPRAPSEKVKARLFGDGTAAAESHVRHPAWHWLAPSMAVFLLGVFIVGRPVGGFGPYASPSLLATVALADSDHAAFLASAHHSDNNAVQVTSFDWTNGSHSVTTAPPVSRTRTNSLMQ